MGSAQRAQQGATDISFGRGAQYAGGGESWSSPPGWHDDGNAHAGQLPPPHTRPSQSRSSPPPLSPPTPSVPHSPRHRANPPPQRHSLPPPPGFPSAFPRRTPPSLAARRGGVLLPPPGFLFMPVAQQRPSSPPLQQGLPCGGWETAAGDAALALPWLAGPQLLAPTLDHSQGESALPWLPTLDHPHHVTPSHSSHPPPHPLPTHPLPPPGAVPGPSPAAPVHLLGSGGTVSTAPPVSPASGKAVLSHRACVPNDDTSSGGCPCGGGGNGSREWTDSSDPTPIRHQEFRGASPTVAELALAWLPQAGGDETSAVLPAEHPIIPVVAAALAAGTAGKGGSEELRP